MLRLDGLQLGQIGNYDIRRPSLGRMTMGAQRVLAKKTLALPDAIQIGGNLFSNFAGQLQFAFDNVPLEAGRPIQIEMTCQLMQPNVLWGTLRERSVGADTSTEATVKTSRIVVTDHGRLTKSSVSGSVVPIGHYWIGVFGTAQFPLTGLSASYFYLNDFATESTAPGQTSGTNGPIIYTDVNMTSFGSQWVEDMQLSARMVLVYVPTVTGNKSLNFYLRNVTPNFQTNFLSSNGFGGNADPFRKIIAPVVTLRF